MPNILAILIDLVVLAIVYLLVVWILGMFIAIPALIIKLIGILFALYAICIVLGYAPSPVRGRII